MADYQHIACKDCPCWRQFYTDDWHTPIYVEKMKDNKPLIDSDGNPVIMRAQGGGEKLTWGCCGAKPPEFGTNNQVQVMMRSDWWCESEEKYRAIERHKRAGNGLGTSEGKHESVDYHDLGSIPT